MNKPSILLVNPWIHDFAAYDLWAKPLGLLALATKLRNEGWKPSLIDFVDPDHPSTPRKTQKFQQGPLHREVIKKPPQLTDVRRNFCRYGVSREEITKDLADVTPPRVILVTSMMTYWHTGVTETIALLRTTFPGIPIILGGIYATLIPEHAAQTGADYIFRGPAEAGLSQLLTTISGISPAESPHYDLVFSPALDLVHKVRFLPLLTTRGCPYRCYYCASSQVSPTFVRRPIQDVIGEIRRGLIKWNIKDIALYDDAFLYNAEDHAIPLLKRFIQEFEGLRWHCPNGLHASAITGQVAELLNQAGFETLRLGLESSRDAFHRETGSKTNWRDFRAAVTNLKNAGFSQEQIGVYLLGGLPHQTLNKLSEDVENVLTVGGYPKIAEYSPLPGTILWNESLETAKYPIDEEPLFQNCTLLPCAHESIDRPALSALRSHIAQEVGLKAS